MARNRRGPSSDGSAAIAALIGALLTAAVMGTIAAAKFAWTALKWISTTILELSSADPALRVRARLRVATVTSAVITVAGVASIDRYSERGEWYRLYASYAPAFAVAIIAVAVSLLWLVWRVALRRRAVVVALRLAPGALLIAGVVVASAAFAVDRPTVAGARAALRAGDERRASVEATEVRESDPSASTQAEALLDDLRLLNFRRASSLEERVGFVGQPWLTAAARADVERAVNDELRVEADRALAASDAVKLDRLVAASAALAIRARIEARRAMLTLAMYDGAQCPSLAVETLRTSTEEGLDVLAALRSARARNEPKLAALVQRATRESRESEQLGLWTEARDLARCLRSMTRSDTTPSEAELDRRVAEVTSARDRRQALAAAQAQRDATRAAVRAEDRDPPREARRHGSGRLLCNDGTLSPSCRCDRGSWSGCCSHHGGVSGCDE